MIWFKWIIRSKASSNCIRGSDFSNWEGVKGLHSIKLINLSVSLENGEVFSEKKKYFQ